MASRLPPLWRLARLACAALSVAASISAGAGRAQQAEGDLNLRGEFTEDFPGDAAPEPPGAESPTEPEVKPTKDALPPLKPYKGAERLDRQGGPKGVSSEVAPPPTIAALPTPPKPPRRKPDDKPFDPVGIEVGDLRLTPSVEEDLGWSSNPGLLPGPQKASAFTTTTAEVGLDSDWSTSAVHGDLKGGYTDYFTDHSADAPSGNGVLDGRYDVSRDFEPRRRAQARLDDDDGGLAWARPKSRLRTYRHAADRDLRRDDRRRPEIRPLRSVAARLARPHVL